MNIIYLRVSKENETIQDLESQYDALLEKFELDPSKCILLKERGSAYDLDKIHKRKEFLKLIDMIFSANQVTIKDLYLGNIRKFNQEFNLYIWDYDRIMRNLEFSILFAILTDLFKVNVYSHKEGKIRKEGIKTPAQKFTEYIMYGASAFSSEAYSYALSTNIKKAIVHKKERTQTTLSRKGNKWGRRFRDLKGETLVLQPERINELNKRIINLSKYYRKQKKQFYYIDIISKVQKEFQINISKSYISRLLNPKSI